MKTSPELHFILSDGWGRNSALNSDNIFCGSSVRNIPLSISSLSIFFKASPTREPVGASSISTTFRNREDEYDSAFRELSEKIANRLDLKSYFRGYQSVGKYGSSWLGPTVFEEFGKVDRSDYRSVLAAPIGFLYEHLEVLYDLDLEFGKHTVTASGMEYRRTELPDDSTALIRVLKDHILKEVENIK